MRILSCDGLTVLSPSSKKPTYKGHSIITYLNNESTPDIFEECMLCTAKHCALTSSKPQLYGDIKSGYLR